MTSLAAADVEVEVEVRLVVVVVEHDGSNGSVRSTISIVETLEFWMEVLVLILIFKMFGRFVFLIA